MQIRKKVLALLVSVSLASQLSAQDIHFTQFGAAPMIINPAFTGGFQGLWRAQGVYRSQWNKNVNMGYNTGAVSFDAPIAREIGQDDYLAGGVQFYNDRAGDANLTNNSALISAAYHKGLGEDGNKSLSFGMQGGYTQKSLDITKLYFGSQFENGGFQPGITINGINTNLKYFTAALGAAFSHRINDRISYTIGVSGNNINQPKESFLDKPNNQVGLPMRTSLQLGGDIKFNDRFYFRPAFLYQTQSSAAEMIAGSEFKFVVSGDPNIPSYSTNIFMGGWSRLGDATMFTVGFEHKGFRFGYSYDMTSSAYKSVNNGVGAHEYSLSYIMPDPLDFAKKFVLPCMRF